MAFFSFAEGSAMFDSTPIENMFLLEYLSSAPETCLRVYLYARMLALHPELGGDMAETARFLRLDEDAVYKALEYWERQGLARRLTDHPPTYELIPPRSDGAGTTGINDSDYYVYRDFNASLQALFGKKLIEPHDYRVANDWLDVLGYDQEAVLRLVRYGIETSRSREPSPHGVFDRMKKLAKAWADEGCRTAEEVEQFILRQQIGYPVAKAVIKRFNQRREPTMDEVDCAKKWVSDWKLTEEQVLDACGETTKSSKPTFAYLDAILKSRLDGNDAYWQPLAEVLKELDPMVPRPTPDDMSRYAELLARGFEAQTIRLAAVQCHRRKRNRLEDVENMLNQWAEQGAYTHEAAEAYIEELKRKSDRVQPILEACGLERRPNKSDVAFYDKWKVDHDEAVIGYAAACARGTQLPMKYMDKLLSAWREAGVKTVEDAKASREAAHAARAATSVPVNPALDYAQREYKDEDFGDDFYFDVVKEYGSGGDQK